MPTNAISSVHAMGREQKMPETLAFHAQYGVCLMDWEYEMDNEDDSVYSSIDSSASDSNLGFTLNVPDLDSVDTSILDTEPKPDRSDDYNDDQDDNNDDCPSSSLLLLT